MTSRMLAQTPEHQKISKNSSDKFFERNIKWQQGKQNLNKKKKEEMVRSRSKELTFKPDTSKSRKVSPI